MMSKQLGRPPSHPPALAFEVRRYLTLVQVLAVPEASVRESGILHLCEVWHVAPAPEMGETLHRLAQHVTEYHQSRLSK